MAILSSLYTGGQVCRQVFELSTGNNLLLPGIAALIDFVGDQVWHSLFSYHNGALFLNSIFLFYGIWMAKEGFMNQIQSQN